MAEPSDGSKSQFPYAIGGITIDRNRKLVLEKKWKIRDEDQIATRATGKFTASPSLKVNTYLDEGQTTGQCWMNGTVLQPILVEKKLVVERATTLEQYHANPCPSRRR